VDPANTNNIISDDLSAADKTKIQAEADLVRRLHRTSLPIPHAGGTYPPKPCLTSSAAFSHLKATGTRRLESHCPTRSAAAIPSAG